jgi:thiamine kinase-like enzyme
MHGDYRLDNMFFASAEGGDPLVVIDWQIASRGRGIFDVAYFLTGTMDAGQRRAQEMDLLRMYHSILLDGGVTGYDFDQLLLDYRASVLYCWLYVVIVLGTLDVATERGLALFTNNMGRGVAALQDHKAAELLPP